MPETDNRPPAVHRFGRGLWQGAKRGPLFFVWYWIIFAVLALVIRAINGPERPTAAGPFSAPADPPPITERAWPVPPHPNP